MAEQIETRAIARRSACIRRHARTRRARSGIREFPHDHPIAATKGSDNIIHLRRSVIRLALGSSGPERAADVTAMGVFSDILKLLNYLPH